MKQSIDDLFNKKLSDSKTAFNEAHWEDMAKLLDNERDRKPRGLWIILSTMLAIALVGYVVYWSVDFNSTDPINANLNNEQIKSKQQESNSLEKPLNQIANEDRQTNTPSIVSKSAENKRQSKSGLLSDLGNGKINSQVNQNLATSKNNNQSPLIISEKESNLTNILNQSTTDTYILASSSSQEARVNDQNESQRRKGQNLEDTNSTNSSINLINNQAQAIVQPKEKIKRASIKDRKLLISTPINTLSILPIRDDLLFDIPMLTMTKVRRKQVVFGLNIYAINYPYFKSSEKFLVGYGIGPVLTFPLSNKLSLNTGLNYQNRSGNFDIVQSTEQIEYSFGRNVMKSEIQPSSLHYIEFPLSVSKRLRKGAISGGVFASYLFNVRGHLIKRTEGPNPVIMESSMANVVNDGFTVWNFGISATYDRVIKRNLVFETKLKYHINEITRKDFEVLNNYLLKENQNLNLQIGLKYYFNK